jgi:hypothetical protein
LRRDDLRQRLADERLPTGRQQQRPVRQRPARQHAAIGLEAPRQPGLDHARQHLPRIAIQEHEARLRKRLQQERDAQRVLRRLLEHAQRRGLRRVAVAIAHAFMETASQLRHHFRYGIGGIEAIGRIAA